MTVMYKYQVAERAGVSKSTFTRWLKSIETKTLVPLGYSRSDKYLKGHVLSEVLKHFCID